MIFIKVSGNSGKLSTNLKDLPLYAENQDIFKDIQIKMLKLIKESWEKADEKVISNQLAELYKDASHENHFVKKQENYLAAKYEDSFSMSKFFVEYAHDLVKSGDSRDAEQRKNPIGMQST